MERKIGAAEFAARGAIAPRPSARGASHDLRIVPFGLGDRHDPSASAAKPVAGRPLRRRILPSTSRTDDENSHDEHSRANRGDRGALIAARGHRRSLGLQHRRLQPSQQANPRQRWLAKRGVASLWCRRLGWSMARCGRDACTTIRLLAVRLDVVAVQGALVPEQEVAVGDDGMRPDIFGARAFGRETAEFLVSGRGCFD